MAGFGDKLMGLLSDPRTMDIGMGLLSAGGPSFTPHNMGQDMAGAYQYATGREGERAQLEMQRMQLNQQKKQQAARAQIGQIYANTQTPQQIGQGVMGQMGILGAGPGMLNPQTQAQYVRANQGLNAINNQRQQQLPGLLSEAYPEQYGAAQIKGLFDPQGSQLSSGVRDFAAMSGMQPTDPRFMSAYQQYQIDSKPIDPSRQIADQLAGLQVEERLADRTRERQEQETIERTRVTGRNSSLREVDSLVSLLEQAEGTGAQSGKLAEAFGTSSSILAGIQRFAGFDPTRAEEIATLGGKIAKGFARLNGVTIPDAYLGSNAKLEFFSAGLGGRDQESGVNFSILKALVQDLKDADYADDGEIQDEAKYDVLLNRISKIMGAEVIDYGDLP